MVKSYLPAGALASTADGDRFLSDCYNYKLSVLGEVNYYPAAPTGIETYRLLLLPTFTHPLVVCVSGTDTTSTYYSKRGSGQGGFDPGELAESATGAIGQSTWHELKLHVENCRFWLLPSFDESHVGGDGTRW